MTHTARNGKVSKLEQVYLRGSHLKFVVLPEILKNAPVFKKVRVCPSQWDRRRDSFVFFVFVFVLTLIG